jgi:hypothetical protein
MRGRQPPNPMYRQLPKINHNSEFIVCNYGINYKVAFKMSGPVDALWKNYLCPLDHERGATKLTCAVYDIIGP